MPRGKIRVRSVPGWHRAPLRSYRKRKLPRALNDEPLSAFVPLIAHSHGSSWGRGEQLWKFGKDFDSVYLGMVEARGETDTDGCVTSSWAVPRDWKVWAP